MESSWSFVPEDKGSFLSWELKTPSNFSHQNIDNHHHHHHQGFEELGRITSNNPIVVADPNAFSTREEQQDLINSKLSNSMGDNNGYNSLIDLKLGRFVDQGDGLGPTFSKGSTTIMSSSESSAPPKRVRASGVHSQTAYCQVYGCNKDLSGCKDYHKRHKVCEVHSKTSKVIVNGIEQRFCQQCSRFHLLAEFDDGKRSCRKRLAGHNERRRKPQVGIHSGKAGRLLHPYGDSRFHGNMLTSTSFICQEILPSGVLSSEKYGTSNWWRPIKAEDGGTSFRPLSSIPITTGFRPSYSDKQFPFLHENGSTSATGSIFCENNGQYPPTLGGSISNSGSHSLFQDTSLGSEDFNVFDTESTVQGLSGISDAGCALSLLSSQSQNSSSQSSGIHIARPLVIPNNHSHYSMSQVSEKMIGISSQTSSGVSDRFPSELNPILISDNNGLERKIRPKMTLPIFLRIVALGFLEPVLDQNLYNMGMKMTSTTFASATVNVLPAITFIMALTFRLETINWKKVHSVAKVVGTVITVSGAMVMTLYKGPAFQILKGGGAINHHGSAPNADEPTDQNWVMGPIMLIASCCSWAGFFILQSFTLKKYPAELSLTAWICLMGIIEGSIASLIFERDFSVWVIGWDSRLLACVYSGVICSGMAYYVQGVVTRERGPVFVTSFSPLCMIITAALGSLVLAEQVHLGSIFGAILIVCGLYTVVWGKSKDRRCTTNEEGKGEVQELPIKNGARSEQDIFEGIEVNVPADKLKKGAGKNVPTEA